MAAVNASASSKNRADPAGSPRIECQFVGSGTTILAAEKVGRIPYTMEYEPKYVDAAIGRWQRMTKLQGGLRSAQDRSPAGRPGRDSEPRHG
jgi:hypothetical protein